MEDILIFRNSDCNFETLGKNLFPETEDGIELSNLHPYFCDEILSVFESY